MKYTKKEMVRIFNNIYREIEHDIKLQEKIINNSPEEDIDLMKEVFNIY